MTFETELELNEPQSKFTQKQTFSQEKSKDMNSYDILQRSNDFHDQ